MMSALFEVEVWYNSDDFDILYSSHDFTQAAENFLVQIENNKTSDVFSISLSVCYEEKIDHDFLDLGPDLVTHEIASWPFYVSGVLPIHEKFAMEGYYDFHDLPPLGDPRWKNIVISFAIIQIDSDPHNPVIFDANFPTRMATPAELLALNKQKSIVEIGL